MAEIEHYARLEPKQFLNDHLQGVHCLIDQLFKRQQPCLLLPYRQSILKMAEHHDTGKYTTFFQKRLIDGNSSELSYHTHISALYHFISQLPDNFPAEVKIAEYLAIKGHHGVIDVSKAFIKNDSDQAILKLQAEDLLKKNTPLDKDILGKIKDTAVLNKQIMRQLRPMVKKGKSRNFFLIQGIASLLSLADKLDAAGISVSYPHDFSPDIVDQYLVQKHGSIDLFKLQARRSVLRTLEQLNDQEFSDTLIYSLTAPTGMGKTLTAVQAALWIRKKVKQTTGVTPKIIYAVPFINIIEQIRDDFEHLFRSHAAYHYSLADYNVSSGVPETATKPLNAELMLLNAWEEDVVLTTFVQLFHSIVSWKMTSLMKFINLSHAIVILDEVQAIPDKYKAFIGCLITEISRCYKTRFILTTATQPNIMSFASKILPGIYSPKELLPKAQKDLYVQAKASNRTCLISLLENDNKKNKRKPEDFPALFEKYYNGGSALVVVNTIDTSRRVYQTLQKRYPDRIKYLSTTLIPVHRRKVINEVKQLLKCKPVILVSTQTVEAGVDLDFDMGFREIAPWDALIQVAGRVNRFGEKPDNSPVYVFSLADRSSLVYGRTVLDIVEKQLCEAKEIRETDYTRIVEQYYQEYVLNNTEIEESKYFWNAVEKLDYKTLNHDFSLIEDADAVDIFIELNQDAAHTANLLSLLYQKTDEETLRKMVKIVFGRNVPFSFKNPYDIVSLRRLVWRKMRLYMVSVRRKNELQPLLQDLSARLGISQPTGVYLVPITILSKYYENETGVKEYEFFG